MTRHTSGTRWFLAQLKPNSAKIAAKNLARQGFDTFLPLEEHTTTRNGQFVTTKRPLFPGYMFVAFDAALGLWHRVNSTYGVARLVAFGQHPAPVPIDMVPQLMLRCDATGTVLPPKLAKPGDKVVLTKGPFANFIAEVERLAPDQRVWLLMDIMGSQTRVAVGSDQIRAC